MEHLNWSKISTEISEVSEKIKNKIDEEDLVDDLKLSFSESVENISDILKKIISTIELTVTDEDIKNETKKVIDSISAEFGNILQSSKKPLDNMNKNNIEEE